jgi:predicted phosphodiesterase
LDHYKVVTDFCKGYRGKLDKFVEKKPEPIGKKRSRILCISDLHVPFWRDDLVNNVIKKYSGCEYCVVNGDLFDNHLISTFPKQKEIPFAIEYALSMEIVKHLAKHFGKVILVDGNHDAGRFTRELGKLNNSIKFLLKSSPLQYIADGRNFSHKGKDLGTINLPNVEYAGETGPGWYTQIGQVIFGHKTGGGFKRAPMANAIQMTDWFIKRGTKFQCFVSAHSHRVGLVPHLGKIVIDQGALCYPLEYEKSGRCTMPPPDLGYAIIDIDSKGNIDPETTRPVFLGTYQEE